MSEKRSRSGSVLMEFIIVAPLMLIFISMILQFSQIWIARHITAYAAYCAARSVLSAGSVSEAQQGAKRAAELACAWMCLAGLPGSAKSTGGGVSTPVYFSKLHQLPQSRDIANAPVTVDYDNGSPVLGEIDIPGWGAIPGSNSSDARVQTTVETFGGQYDPVSGKVQPYALVKVEFKFPALLPLAGRMVSWFVNTDDAGLGRAGTVGYGTHVTTADGKITGWRGQSAVMQADGSIVDDDGTLQWGGNGQFPVVLLTEYCMLPMPYSVDRGLGADGFDEFTRELNKVGL